MMRLKLQYNGMVILVYIYYLSYILNAGLSTPCEVPVTPLDIDLLVLGVVI